MQVDYKNINEISSLSEKSKEIMEDYIDLYSEPIVSKQQSLVKDFMTEGLVKVLKEISIPPVPYSVEDLENTLRYTTQFIVAKNDDKKKVLDFIKKDFDDIKSGNLQKAEQDLTDTERHLRQLLEKMSSREFTLRVKSINTTIQKNNAENKVKSLEKIGDKNLLTAILLGGDHILVNSEDENGEVKSSPDTNYKDYKSIEDIIKENVNNVELEKDGLLRKRLEGKTEEEIRAIKNPTELSDEANTNDVIDSIVGKYDEQKHDTSIRYTGTEFEKILISGIDFISNHYDARLYVREPTDTEDHLLDYYNKDNNRKLIIKEGKSMHYLNPIGFSVRVVSINIPLMKNQTFELATVKHGIKKFHAAKDYSKKATFTFRMDNQLAWLRFIGALSGENNFKKNKDDYSYYYGNSMPHNYSKNYSLSDNYGLCLVVSDIDLSPIHKNSPKVKNQYIFENIKFLNTDNLNYNMSGGPQEMSVEFIYKRLFSQPSLKKGY